MSQSLDSIPEHIRRPHLRPIQPLPMKTKDGKPLVALRDPAQLSQQTMVVPPQVMGLLQHFRGDRPLDQIAAQLNGSVDQFIELAKALDKVGLLWGPTFEELEAKVKSTLASTGAFPMRASQMLGKDPAACRAAIEGFLKQTEDPELGANPIGLVAPHLDYQRGWPNYAAAYFPLQNVPAPDRVVILGTNHFGMGDGVVLSELGFNSPMGLCPPDKPAVSMLSQKLGRPITIDILDHLPEHSIELHLPWLQYFWGNVPVIAALVPDPLAPMIANDGQRIAAQQFVDALSETLLTLGGSTFFVASSDLSHVGPQFGEPRPVDEQRRFDVERHDREMMAKFLSGDADEFIAAMKWNKNPTRWCSIGNMSAVLSLAKPRRVELIDYRQAFDDNGTALVSSAAIALL